MVLRIALLGAGAMGTIMARDIYPSLESVVQVVAVIDSNPERRSNVAQVLGASGYETLDAALERERLDGVDIRLPHVAHSAAVQDALARGLHALVEKPLVTTEEAIAQIEEAVSRSSRTVAVAENYPHLRSTQAAQSAIHSGEIGEVLGIRTIREFTLDGIWSATGWRQAASAEAGILWDQGTHHTSLLRSLAGEVRTVSARAAVNLRTPGAETITLDTEFDSGLTAQSFYCWGTPGVDAATEAVILGSEGRIEITVDYEGRSGCATLIRPKHDPVRLSEPECYYDSHGWIVADWADAIERSRPPRVTVDSAVRDVRVVLAARASLASGSVPTTTTAAPPRRR